MCPIPTTSYQPLISKSVYAIRQRTEGLFDFSDEALGNIESYLFKRCTEFLGPTLALKLAVLPDILAEVSRFPSNVSGTRLKNILTRLSFASDPLVEEMAQRAVALSTRSIIRAIKRIARNKKTLYDWLGHEPKQIEKIRIHDGETHNLGGQVIIFYFHGGTFVYKPVDLRAQRFFNEASKNIMTMLGINGKGGPDVLVAEPRYGIMEYIEPLKTPLSHDTCKIFYYRAGILLAVTHCLKIVDIHHDNFFMTPEGPMILDVETLFYPFLEGYLPTVIDTRLVGHGKYSGVEGGGPLRKIGVHVQQFMDRLIVNYDKPVFLDNNRIPGTGKASLIDPNIFRENIREGFREGYIKMNRGKDSIFKAARRLLKNNITSRLIVRNTAYYLVKQLSLIQPKHIEKNKNVSRIKSALARKLAIKHQGASLLIQKEIQDLLNADIPYFYTKSLTRHLYHGLDICIDNFFSDSQLTRLKKYASLISDKDMECQLEIMDQPFT